MKLERSNLVSLLNALHDLDVDYLDVSHPSSDVGDLVEFELGDPRESTVRFEHDSDSYADARNQVGLDHGDRAQKELPDSRDYANCMMAAGVLEAENHDEVLEFLEREGRVDVKAGHEPVFAGFDTNLLPWAPQDVFGMDPLDSDEDRPLINGFTVASGVREELTWDAKHSKNDAFDLVDAFGDEFEEFIGQPAGANRVGRLGIVQYTKLRSHSYGEQVECDRGDDAIVNAYDEYTRDRRREVVLLSNDHNFVERAKNSFVPAERIVFPDVPRKSSASWEEIADSIYYLAVAFGVVILPKATVYGVWRGKDGNEWTDEMVKVDCRSPKLQDQLERNIDVLKAY